MSRPTLEVADIVRRTGNSFWEQQQSHLAWPHRKVLDAIVRCRTAALGGHRDQCVRCGHQAISFNSCRNRHCPKCQGNARAKWLAARSAELLPCRTSMSSSRCRTNSPALALQNKRLLYDLLFRASAADHARTRSRSQAPGSRDRLPRRAPYLGAEPRAEPSLMMPGIIISFVFNKQGGLVFHATPFQN